MKTVIELTIRERRKLIEEYIISCIDGTGYDGWKDDFTPKEKAQFVFKCFEKEYDFMIKRVGAQLAFKEWLMGLPTVFTVEFYNDGILELLEKWAIKYRKGHEHEAIERYWNGFYMPLKRMANDKGKAGPFVRKTIDEYVLLADYGQGFEEETVESTYADIKARLNEYRTNAPEYIYTYKKRRVKK